MIFMGRVHGWLQQQDVDCICWKHDALVGNYIYLHKAEFSALCGKSEYNVMQNFYRNHFVIVTPQFGQYNERIHACFTSVLVSPQTGFTEFTNMKKLITQQKLRRTPHPKGKKKNAVKQILGRTPTVKSIENDVASSSMQRGDGQTADIWADATNEDFDDTRAHAIEDNDTVSMTDWHSAASDAMESETATAVGWDVRTENVMDETVDMELDEAEGVIRPRLCSFDSILDDIAQSAMQV